MAIKIKQAVLQEMIDSGVVNAEELNAKIAAGEIIVTGSRKQPATQEERDWLELTKKLRNEFEAFLQNSETFNEFMGKFAIKVDGKEFPQVDLLIKGKRVCMKQLGVAGYTDDSQNYVSGVGQDATVNGEFQQDEQEEIAETVHASDDEDFI